MSRETPWFKFYPADWRADQGLRIVSLAARGLWIECMCIMHDAEPYGHLVVNGRPVTDGQLAALTGTSADQIADLLAELESAGVFSRNGKGLIYSRRMTRDLKMARNARNNGRKGGNPKLSVSDGKESRNQASDNPHVKGVDKGGVKGGDKAQKPEARSQSPESESSASSPGDPTARKTAPNDATTTAPRPGRGDPSPPAQTGGSELVRLGDACLEAMGWSPGQWTGSYAQVRTWLTAGYTAAQIEAAAKATGAKLAGKRIASPFAYLAKALPEEVERQREAAAAEQAAADGPIDLQHRTWELRVKSWIQRDRGFWPDCYGPRPGQPGCEVPRDILARYDLIAEEPAHG